MEAEQTQARRPEKSILSDLSKIQIPDNIKVEAEKIFQQLDLRTKRGKRRKRLLFYCVYNAYKTLGQTKDPKIVASVVGIANKEITKAFSMCSAVQTNYQPPTKQHSPEEYIQNCMDLVGLNQDCYQDVVEKCQIVLNADPSLEEEYPQNVAIAVVYLYIIINGGKLDRKDFSEIFKLSGMTIYKMYNRVEAAYNSQ